MLARSNCNAGLRAVPVSASFSAKGDVFHLWGDDAATCVVHLSHVGARLGAARDAEMFEAQAGQRRISGGGTAIGEGSDPQAPRYHHVLRSNRRASLGRPASRSMVAAGSV